MSKKNYRNVIKELSCFFSFSFDGNYKNQFSQIIPHCVNYTIYWTSITSIIFILLFFFFVPHFHQLTYYCVNGKFEWKLIEVEEEVRSFLMTNHTTTPRRTCSGVPSSSFFTFTPLLLLHLHRRLLWQQSMNADDYQSLNITTSSHRIMLPNGSPQNEKERRKRWLGTSSTMEWRWWSAAAAQLNHHRVWTEEGRSTRRGGVGG